MPNCSCGRWSGPAPLEAHPGWIALISCTAAAAYLIVGAPGWMIRSAPGRGLVILGRYSYSLYLVHYPVITLLFYQPFAGWRGAEGEPARILLTLATIAGLTVGMYHLVEQRARGGLSRRSLAIAIVVVGGVLTGGLIVEPGYHRSQFSSEQRLILAGAGDRTGDRCGQIGVVPSPFRSCSMAQARPGQPTILLVGDSHADSIREGLRRAARRAGDGLRIHSARCVVGRGTCGVDALMGEARVTDASVLIFAGLPSRFEPEAVVGLVDASQRHEIASVMLDPVTIHAFNTISALSEWTRSGRPPPVQTLSDYRARNRSILALAERLHGRGLVRIDTGKVLCSPICSLISPDGMPYYFDHNHLTTLGAARLEPAFDSLLARPDLGPSA